ncbi:predicted protein [Aspergillus terreus NIH2624]|uniref:Uncharacterized protein n=1 Tax=Aspergillus terreus (strain NIH 2624 / FGSC A1156) TaxID=341663 RepID=Q0CV95_ASPTN|nr:uncharacterized protein ATEG_02389 [Aspergillus terreus NIH2624]EAU37351.1 predicted protein [Aspergillus terreus NIH2624]
MPSDMFYQVDVARFIFCVDTKRAFRNHIIPGQRLVACGDKVIQFLIVNLFKVTLLHMGPKRDFLMKYQAFTMAVVHTCPTTNAMLGLHMIDPIFFGLVEFSRRQTRFQYTDKWHKIFKNVLSSMYQHFSNLLFCRSTHFHRLPLNSIGGWSEKQYGHQDSIKWDAVFGGGGSLSTIRELLSSSLPLAGLSECTCFPRSGSVLVVAMLGISDSEPLGDFVAGIVLELEDRGALRLAISDLDPGTVEAK